MLTADLNAFCEVWESWEGGREGERERERVRQRERESEGEINREKSVWECVRGKSDIEKSDFMRLPGPFLCTMSERWIRCMMRLSGVVYAPR